MQIEEFLEKLQQGTFDDTFRLLYGASSAVLTAQKERYARTVRQFAGRFPERKEIRVFSAPGRSEIGGNHTDHQHGCALGAAVNLDVIAVVSFHEEGVIRYCSEGYGTTRVDLADLSVQKKETGKSSAIIRGMAAGIAGTGASLAAFDAFSDTKVQSGSGLSSSAAFEVLIGTILSAGAATRVDPIELARIGQYAENVYFGKGSGLLDQAVCSVGGFVFLDFADADHPGVEKIDYDFEKAGYALCVTDTHGSHADLTADYTAVPEEMCRVAAVFGKDVLRQVDEETFFRSLPELRKVCTDREILRAVHFFGENRRAICEAEALKKGDPEDFLRLYRQSAASSANLLQNLYSCQKPAEQAIPLAIMMSRRILGEDAAVRVHGGGFAGTIQAFVPTGQVKDYVGGMDELFGEGSCHVLRIRPVGGVEITG